MNVIGFNLAILSNCGEPILYMSCLYKRKEVSFNELHYKSPVEFTWNFAVESALVVANPYLATTFALVEIAGVVPSKFPSSLVYDPLAQYGAVELEAPKNNQPSVIYTPELPEPSNIRFPLESA